MIVPNRYGAADKPPEDTIRDITPNRINGYSCTKRTDGYSQFAEPCSTSDVTANSQVLQEVRASLNLLSFSVSPLPPYPQFPR